MEELWKPISGFEDYMVSNSGRIWSKKRNKFLSQKKNRYGYLMIRLYKNGDDDTLTVHRLVAKAFLPNPEGYEEVHHINEQKTDNRVENLEWCSRQYNTEFSQAGHYVLYDPSDEPIKIYNLRKFARQNNLSQAGLKNVAKGKAISYLGYTVNPGVSYTKKRTGSFKLKSQEGEIVTFNNQYEAADTIDSAQSYISQLLSGRRKSCKGWTLP
jgi:hypothetical protein